MEHAVTFPPCEITIHDTIMIDHPAVLVGAGFGRSVIRRCECCDWSNKSIVERSFPVGPAVEISEAQGFFGWNAS